MTCGSIGVGFGIPVVDTGKVRIGKDRVGKVITSGVNAAEDPVNEIINIFYNSINPTINYGNKTSRGAADWLIKKYGLEETTKLAEAACSVHGMPYAPVITTPYQLKEKLSQLGAYIKKNNQTVVSI